MATMMTRSTPLSYHISRGALLGELEKVDDDEIRFATSVLRLQPASWLCRIEIKRDTGVCFLILDDHDHQLRLAPDISERILDSLRSPTLGGHP